MSAENPKFSVVLCTFNRAGILHRALDSILAQKADSHLFEILAVDNNSTDETRSVVESYRSKNERIRYYFEPKQGLSNARNRGWREAAGEYVAFIDDDISAPACWLESAMQILSSVQPEPVALGGPVINCSSRPIPGWLEKYLNKPVWGAKPRFLDSGETLYGANMIIKRDVLENEGGFDSALGVKKYAYSASEENRLFKEIRKIYGKRTAYYSPDLQVYHFMPPEMLAPAFFIRRSFAKGQLSIKLEKWMGKSPSTGIFAHSLLLFFKIAIRALVERTLFQNGDEWKYKFGTEIARELGKMLEILGITINIRYRR